MRVRLLQAAEIQVDPIGRVWYPPGTECDIPDEQFDPTVHVDLTPPAAPAAAPATGP